MPGERLKKLEKENSHLKKAVAELTLDKLILKEALEDQNLRQRWFVDGCHTLVFRPFILTGILNRAVLGKTAILKVLMANSEMNY